MLDVRYRSYNPYSSAPEEPEAEEEKPGRRVRIGRRKKKDEPEPEPDPNEGWICTTHTFLVRDYRPLDGMNARELVS